MGRGEIKLWLQETLEAGDLDAIGERAVQEPKILSLLVARSYDSEEQNIHRAVTALGQVAGRVSDEHPEVVRDLLRRQMWLLVDESGANAWTAEACIFAILAARPGRFPEFEQINRR